ncbi:MAG TPA: fibronectin type III domain-containing protein [Thermoanaerobaculia bacterium]|jgi:hypothetical protein
MNRPTHSHLVSLLALTAILLTASLPAYGATNALVPMRSIWKYLDNGTNQGTAWRARSFDDSTWSSGWSELGYGERDEATVVSYGPDPLRRYMTTYFRQNFNVTNPAAITALTARLIRDDGAVVYINGTEVARVNLPTGTISYTTSAVTSISDADETTPIALTLNPSVLVAGSNTIAVEMHQAGGSSSDLSFSLELLATDDVDAPAITRGPYLQVGTPNSVIVRWRTATPSDSRVSVGTALGALNMVFDDPTETTEHIVQVSGLEPSTRYYYSVGTSKATIVGDASSYSFLTSPPRGTDVSTRIWVLGDSGSGTSGARAVRNAYYSYSTPAATNLWLMLGDNAYENGTDAEYQVAVFDMYPEMLRGSVLWPTIGNHETRAVGTNYGSMAYYGNFTLPTKGEAGGVPSGTKAYYSFDYGTVHFICLDSMTSDRSPNGPMLTWLRDDLASTSQPWVIAFWHHPPYSKGSHDSDVEGELIEMRENALPILEAAGVDLVLAGHSHAYERSYLLDGHYGYSNTLTSSMKVDGTDGNTRGGGAYQKPGLNSHEGAVYVVSGSGAMASGGPLNHPAMYISLNNLGSLVLDVRGNTLSAKFLRETGLVADSFQIEKGNRAPAAATALTATAASETGIDLAWTDGSSNEDGFRIERCTGTGCTSFTQVGQVAPNVTKFADSTLTAATAYRYRVQAYNKIGATPSTAAEATTLGTPVPTTPNPPTGLGATTPSATQINLAWTDNSANEDGFRIERCSGASCADFTQVAQTATNVTTYSDSALTASTLYRYRVVAFNAGGVSATSSIAESTTQAAPTAPAAAASVSGNATSTTQIDLTWTDASDNEQGFRIERCSGAACTSFTQVAELAAGTSSYSDTGLTQSTLYRYRVLAYNNVGSSSSNIAEATTQTAVTIPLAPTSVSAAATSTTQINLGWTDASNNEDGFRVERCAGASCTSFTQVAQLAAGVTTYSDTALTPSTLYRYRVSAYNSAGAAASAVAEAKTQTPVTVPAAPTGLSATAASTTEINLAWTDASNNEDGFRIERCAGAACTTFAQVAQVAAGVKTYSDTALTPSTLYRYRVSAYTSAGAAASTVAEAKTQTPVTVPVAPSGLTAAAASTTQINLAWTDNSANEDGFRIERCTGTGCTSFTQVAQVGAGVRTFSNTGLAAGTVYRFRVRSYNSAGASAASNEAQATTQPATPPAAPTSLVASASGARLVNLSWTDASTNEAGFRIERCAGNNCTNFTQIAQIGANLKTFADNSTTGNNFYRYRVRAYNAYGNSAYTAVVTVKTPNR